MLPFEFIVDGPPLSHQTRSRRKLAAWRRRVRAAAAARWGRNAPLNKNLQISVAYYHEGLAVRIDNDNMIKPIQDALIGLVYVDDRLITHTFARKMSIDGLFRVRGHSLVLLEGFSRGHEFLHILIDDAPAQGNP